MIAFDGGKYVGKCGYTFYDLATWEKRRAIGPFKCYHSREWVLPCTIYMLAKAPYVDPGDPTYELDYVIFKRRYYSQESYIFLKLKGKF